MLVAIARPNYNNLYMHLNVPFRGKVLMVFNCCAAPTENVKAMFTAAAPACSRDLQLNYFLNNCIIFI